MEWNKHHFQHLLCSRCLGVCQFVLISIKSKQSTIKFSNLVGTQKYWKAKVISPRCREVQSVLLFSDILYGRASVSSLLSFLPNPEAVFCSFHFFLNLSSGPYNNKTLWWTKLLQIIRGQVIKIERNELFKKEICVSLKRDIVEVRKVNKDEKWMDGLMA